LLHKKSLVERVIVTATVALLGCLMSRPGFTAPLEVYGRLPSLENVALSPDGSLIALVKTTANDRILVIHSLVDHKRVGSGLRIGTAKLRSIQWADNNHLMLFASVTGMPWGLTGPTHEWFLLSVWDLAKQKLSSYPDLSKSDVRIMNNVHDGVMVRRLEGHTVLFIPGTYVTDLTLPSTPVTKG
jgi:hypothetical protein